MARCCVGLSAHRRASPLVRCVRCGRRSSAGRLQSGDMAPSAICPCRVHLTTTVLYSVRYTVYYTTRLLLDCDRMYSFVFVSGCLFSVYALYFDGYASHRSGASIVNMCVVWVGGGAGKTVVYACALCGLCSLRCGGHKAVWRAYADAPARHGAWHAHRFSPWGFTQEFYTHAALTRHRIFRYTQYNTLLFVLPVGGRCFHMINYST